MASHKDGLRTRHTSQPVQGAYHAARAPAPQNSFLAFSVRFFYTVTCYVCRQKAKEAESQAGQKEGSRFCCTGHFPVCRAALHYRAVRADA